MSQYDKVLETMIHTDQEKSLIASLDYAVFIYKQLYPTSSSHLEIEEYVRDFQADVVWQINEDQPNRVSP